MDTAHVISHPTVASKQRKVIVSIVLFAFTFSLVLGRYQNNRASEIVPLNAEIELAFQERDELKGSVEQLNQPNSDSLTDVSHLKEQHDAAIAAVNGKLDTPNAEMELAVQERDELKLKGSVEKQNQPKSAKSDLLAEYLKTKRRKRRRRKKKKRRELLRRDRDETTMFDEDDLFQFSL
jgi:hypothetical protein